MMFLVDSNVLIEAKNRYYAFDIAPGFWEWLESAYQQGEVCSIEAVRDELREGKDELACWADENPDFFKQIDQATTKYYGPLTNWAVSGQYEPRALNGFTSNDADYQLVAYACAHGYVLVTHERSQPNSKKRILIPDACLAMGVETVDTFQMLRQTGVTLKL